MFRTTAVFLLLIGCATAQGAVPKTAKAVPSNAEADSRELALSTTKSLTASSPTQYFRALRAEEYDEPFQPSWLAPKELRAYLVVDSGVEASASGGPIIHTSTGRWEVLIVVDPRQRKAFALRGSPDPLKGFNALVKDREIKVNSLEAALSLFWVFANVAGGYADQVVVEPRAAQWQVEGYQLRSSGGDGLDEVRDAWLKENSVSLRQVVPPHVASAEGGYEVVFFVANGGTVYRRRLLVDSQAAVKNLEDLPITTSLAQPPAGGE